MKNLLLVTICILFSFNFYSQNHTISGFISDKASGEKLIGATVIEVESKKGTSANLYGFYSFTLPEGVIKVRFSYVGYQTVIKEIKLDENIKLNIELISNSTLKEFEVIASQSEKIQEKTQMSSVDVSMEKVKSLPVFLGEQDIMKTIQLLPGVQSGSEGSSGLYVRGGGPDQNLILLDGVPVYNASHLFGFFSVFNADAINSVKLIKGGFPARYGGRLSSVIDIRMKEGNQKEFHGEGSIGLISSKLSLEGPIIKDKTSFIVSARRTYIDILARPLIKAAANQNGSEGTGGYYFYDVNAKINHKFNETSRLYLSGYFGDDKFYANTKDSYTFNGQTDVYDSENSLRWGNVITALRWNKIINDKLFSNTTLRYSKYRFNVGFSEKTTTTDNSGTSSSEFKFDYFSGIEDWAGSVDFDYVPNPNHYIKFGIGDTYHTFRPGVNQFKISESSSEDLDTTFGSQNQFAHEANVYIEDDFKIGELLKFNIGLHGSAFIVKKKTYYSLQPRFSGRYLIDETMSVKASYARMAQFLHLLTNTSIGLPTDLWVPATDRIAPQTSDQIAVGVAKTLKKEYEVSIEGYYKWMNNLIEYKDGASFFGSDKDWQDKVESGKGWSYGGEFLIEKKQGRTTGWIGYTLSWTNRQFEEINFGEVFPYKYDRRHDIGLAVTHKFDKYKDRKERDKWIDVGLVFVYGTGNATTLGLERYRSIPSGFGGGEVVHIDGRNNYRMPNYHRLDLGVNIHTKKKRGERTWSFGLYNAYSRQNPFFLYFGYDNNQRVLKQISLFPILPSFSYNFKF